MGKSDEYYYDYLDDNDRFADQMNGALFQGEQVVSPDELEAEEGVPRKSETACHKL